MKYMLTNTAILSLSGMNEIAPRYPSDDFSVEAEISQRTGKWHVNKSNSGQFFRPTVKQTRDSKKIKMNTFKNTIAKSLSSPKRCYN